MGHGGSSFFINGHPFAASTNMYGVLGLNLLGPNRSVVEGDAHHARKGPVRYGITADVHDRFVKMLANAPQQKRLRQISRNDPPTDTILEAIKKSGHNYSKYTPTAFASGRGQ